MRALDHHDLADPLVIEADTAEQALAQVREQLGEDAEILQARKVQRGGWKGFFALERVELTARAQRRSAGGSIVASQQAADVRQQLQEEEARDRADFERMLRRLMQEPDPAADEASGTQPPPPAAGRAPTAPEELAASPGATSSADARPEPVGEPRVGPVAEPRVGPAVAASSSSAPTTGVAWSCGALEELRIPRAVVAACAALDPRDDVAWVTTIASAVASWCRPLPAGPPAYVGPQLGRLANALGVPLVKFGADRAPEGPVALEAPDTAEGRGWMTRLAGDRWLHVVASGRRWHAFMFEDALALSWTSNSQLPSALSAASRMGMVLGHANVGGAIVRVAPLDVALGVRSLLPRR